MITTGQLNNKAHQQYFKDVADELIESLRDEIAEQATDFVTRRMLDGTESDKVISNRIDIVARHFSKAAAALLVEEGK